MTDSPDATAEIRRQAEVTPVTTRSAIAAARRIVVKVGSSSISGDNAGQIGPLVDALAEAYGRGAQVVLVSSGAIATGMPHLALDSRPTDLATQQAAAAVGQNLLVYRYQESLRRYGIVAGQVLLTAGDMQNPTHRSNAQRAMERLLDLRILPIVNENDTVATHEIRFGDNDRLAALVSKLIGADVLVLLSDVDALYTRPPHEPGAVKIVDVDFGDELAGVTFGDIGAAGVGTGGAGTKVAAARYAADAGTPVLVTSTANVASALRGAEVGTFFSARPDAAGHPDGVPASETHDDSGVASSD
ncbi:glutamate 5-kinase [Frigoribacterium sp. 2-23]|uniref:glutamate 5-kinase n=1 Tax=Frigoribacterium sp. 2-23 TaxID=3415006 RepID=UPI003C6EB91D